MPVAPVERSDAEPRMKGFLQKARAWPWDGDFSPGSACLAPPPPEGSYLLRTTAFSELRPQEQLRTRGPIPPLTPIPFCANHTITQKKDSEKDGRVLLPHV
ncbi:hypothetical protein VULLAG_LOCUS8041 [Vulpes lagopus]